MIKFVLLVNKQGQTRLAKYTDQSMSVEERRALEGEIVRKCLIRAEKQVRSGAWHLFTVKVLGILFLGRQVMLSNDLYPMQCSFVEHRNYKVIYRRYASLFFLVGVEGEEVQLPSGLSCLCEGHLTA